MEIQLEFNLYSCTSCSNCALMLHECFDRAGSTDLCGKVNYLSFTPFYCGFQSQYPLTHMYTIRLHCQL